MNKDILNKLLIVDMQNDFVDPKGSLYVKGAEHAVDNIIKFIEENGDKIDEIILSQDSHSNSHIATIDAWEGEHDLFSVITKEDVINDKATPKFTDKTYLINCWDFLRIDGVTLWPHHCVTGTWGWCFPDKLISALSKWKEDKYDERTWHIVQKGTNDFIEEYSVMSRYDFSNKDRVPFDYIYVGDDVHNINLYIAGVAKDYCVADTVKDLYNALMEFEPSLRKVKFHFIENSMATIDKTNTSLSIYDEMINNGYANKI